MKQSGQKEKRILYVQYANPVCWPPLEHSSRLFADSGWKVLFLGTDALNAGPLNFEKFPGIEIQKLNYCRAGWRQKFHYAWFCLWAGFRTLFFNPHWIYASDPFSCPLALVLSYFYPNRVIYHEHDTPVWVLKENKASSRFIQALSKSRVKLAGRAAFHVLPNEARVRLFRESVRTRRMIYCVWNCPRKEEVLPPRDKGREFILLYHGSVVPTRLPLSIIESMAILPPNVVLKIIGYETLGHEGYVKALESKAQELGIGGRVRYLGAMSRKQVFAESLGAGVGISLIPKISNDVNLSHMTGASNKSFDYLSCGLPLIVSDLPDWQEMFVRPGYAVKCDPENPRSITLAIQWFIEHPAEAAAMGENGRQRILSEWNYENQFSKVLERMDVA